MCWDKKKNTEEVNILFCSDQKYCPLPVYELHVTDQCLKRIFTACFEKGFWQIGLKQVNLRALNKTSWLIKLSHKEKRGTILKQL